MEDFEEKLKGIGTILAGLLKESYAVGKEETASSILADIEGMKKDSAGGHSEFAGKNVCKWCGVGELEYHLTPCRELDAAKHNEALKEISTLIKEKYLK